MSDIVVSETPDPEEMTQPTDLALKMGVMGGAGRNIPPAYLAMAPEVYEAVRRSNVDVGAKRLS